MFDHHVGEECSYSYVVACPEGRHKRVIWVGFAQVKLFWRAPGTLRSTNIFLNCIALSWHAA